MPNKTRFFLHGESTGSGIDGVAADGDGAIISVEGYDTVTLQVDGIGGGSILSPQVSLMGGGHWEPAPAVNVSTGAEATTITTDGIYRVSVTGMKEFYAPISNYTGPDDITVVASVSDGVAVTSSAGGGAASDVNLIEVGGDAIDLGQELMAASVPVAIASNQTPVATKPDPGTAVNVPAIVTADGDALAANADRKLWAIQNLGQNPLFVRMATGASTALFHVILKAGTADDDGTGGFISDELHKGVVSVAGNSPRFVATEIT